MPPSSMSAYCLSVDCILRAFKSSLDLDMFELKIHELRQSVMECSNVDDEEE